MGYRPLVVWCLPLADLHHFRLTKGFPILLPAPSSHLHFASIRLCLALLFIISIEYPFKYPSKRYFLQIINLCKL